MKYKNINQYYVFQTAVSLFIALAAGAMWTLYFLKAPTLHGFNAPSVLGCLLHRTSFPGNTPAAMVVPPPHPQSPFHA